MTSRALLFGLNYSADPDNALFGCINDVENIAEYLTTARPGIDIRLLDDTRTPAACTKAGMLAELNALVDAVNADATCTYVWIHYSGHGSQTRDVSRDEVDGKDEVLVPTDFRSAGFILDDDIARILARFTRPTLKVVCIMDSCHSGTVCDLKYRWTSPVSAVLDNTAVTMTARVILLSGCADTQTSADAFGVLDDKSRPKQAGGALTGCLLNTLQADKTVDAFQVQQGTLRRLTALGFAQKPVLTSSFNLKKDLLLV